MARGRRCHYGRCARRRSTSAAPREGGSVSGTVKYDAARHEAAHAITACQLGLRVDYVRVLEDGSGCAAYEADPTSPVAMLARVVADLAGISGELLEDDVHPWRRTRLAESCDVLVARLNADVCQSLVPAWQLSHPFFAMMSCAVVLSTSTLLPRSHRRCELRAPGWSTNRRAVLGVDRNEIVGARGF